MLNGGCVKEASIAIPETLMPSPTINAATVRNNIILDRMGRESMKRGLKLRGEDQCLLYSMHSLLGV